MLLKELVEKKRVCFHEKFATWEEAVTAACMPIIEDGSIEQEYIEAIIDCVKKYGPYIVLAPDIAMPHSQEGANGVNDTVLSFMKVEQPVHFQKGNPDKDARLFFVLASINNAHHMENMEKLATMLTSEEFVASLLKVKDEKGLLLLDEQFSCL